MEGGGLWEMLKLFCYLGAGYTGAGFTLRKFTELHRDCTCIFLSFFTFFNFY